MCPGETSPRRRRKSSFITSSSSAGVSSLGQHSFPPEPAFTQHHFLLPPQPGAGLLKRVPVQKNTVHSSIRLLIMVELISCVSGWRANKTWKLRQSRFMETSLQHRYGSISPCENYHFLKIVISRHVTICPIHNFIQFMIFLKKKE